MWHTKEKQIKYIAPTRLLVSRCYRIYPDRSLYCASKMVSLSLWVNVYRPLSCSLSRGPNSPLFFGEQFHREEPATEVTSHRVPKGKSQRALRAQVVLRRAPTASAAWNQIPCAREIDRNLRISKIQNYRKIQFLSGRRIIWKRIKLAS